jgi:hypothetical protein
MLLDTCFRMRPKLQARGFLSSATIHFMYSVYTLTIDRLAHCSHLAHRDTASVFLHYCQDMSNRAFQRIVARNFPTTINWVVP